MNVNDSESALCRPAEYAAHMDRYRIRSHFELPSALCRIRRSRVPVTAYKVSLPTAGRASAREGRLCANAATMCTQNRPALLVLPTPSSHSSPRPRGESPKIALDKPCAARTLHTQRYPVAVTAPICDIPLRGCGGTMPRTLPRQNRRLRARQAPSGTDIRPLGLRW